MVVCYPDAWVVLFSPLGLDMAYDVLGIKNTLKFACIGLTTYNAAKSRFPTSIIVVAKKPTAECVYEAIQQWSSYF
jgi:uroporphyrinogen-III synthase